MSTELTAPQAQVRPGSFEWTEQQTRMVREMFAPGASDVEFATMVQLAKARGLNPWTRQCFFIKRYDSSKGKEVWQCQVSIDGARATAVRTGMYAGQDAPEFGVLSDGTIEWCKVAVWRKDSSRPTVAVAYFEEYAQTKRSGELNAMWRDRPRTMLSKCGEMLALRKAFPEDMSGLYIAEEFGDDEARVREVTAPRQTERAERADVQIAAPQPAKAELPAPSPPAESVVARARKAFAATRDSRELLLLAGNVLRVEQTDRTAVATAYRDRWVEMVTALDGNARKRVLGAVGAMPADIWELCDWQPFRALLGGEEDTSAAETDVVPPDGAEEYAGAEGADY